MFKRHQVYRSNVDQGIPRIPGHERLWLRKCHLAEPSDQESAVRWLGIKHYRQGISRVEISLVSLRNRKKPGVEQDGVKWNEKGKTNSDEEIWILFEIYKEAMEFKAK